MTTGMYKLMIGLILFAFLLSSGVSMGWAQDGPRSRQAALGDTPEEPGLPPRPDRRGEAEPRYRHQESRQKLSNLDVPVSQINQPQLTGPDEFGYTWDYISFSWKDASSGTDTGMSGYADPVGPIALPFSFKYYENSYSEIWISPYGYLSFNDEQLWQWQSDIPDPYPPNDVIAPYWTPTYFDPGAWVRYLTGGTAPNRYFVIEWHDVQGGDSNDDTGGDDQYRFEVIIHENGNIDFQYQIISINGYSRWCGTSGIEDSDGQDGLTNVPYCGLPSESTAVRFYRPAPAGRVRIDPKNDGSFSSAGAIVEYDTLIKNIGELGLDTYDLSASSSWAIYLFDSDGITLLSDTDGDGLVDTGPIAQGSSKNIVMKIQVPGGAEVGSNNAATVTATSSVTTANQKTATLRTAVPTQFAQISWNDSLYQNSIFLVKPGAQALKTVHDEYTAYPAVSEMANGNMFNIWSEYGCLDPDCNLFGRELLFNITNPYGEVVRPASHLTEHSTATLETYDLEPVVAATPDGKIGVAWTRNLSRYVTDHWEYNDNIIFAVLHSSGSLAYGPINLTNNNGWQNWDNPTNVPYFFSAQIAGISDNRYAIAWVKKQFASQCNEYDCYYTDIYYTVRSSGGSEVKSITKHTTDTIGDEWEGYFNPGIASLQNNRFLLSWYRDSDADIYYSVFDSTGSAITAKNNLSADGSNIIDYQSDAAQLSDGRIAIAWFAWENDPYKIRFAILDSSYNRIAGPTILSNPASVRGDVSVSVSADTSGRAVLSWTDYDYKNLYYALLNSNGSVVTPPMIFMTDPSSILFSSGYGNTTYSSAIPAGVDAALLMSNGDTGGAPGETVPVFVHFTNHGQTTATNVSFSMTLGSGLSTTNSASASGLTYLSDTSGTTPVIVGDTITWNLPDVPFLQEVKFIVYLGVPLDAPIGATYPLTFNLTAADETNPGDNVSDGQVMAGIMMYLPNMLK